MDTFKVELDRAVYAPTVDKITVGHRQGMVVLFVGKKAVELNTVAAHKVGFTMATAKPEPGEMIFLSINGERVPLLQPVAVKVAGALLKKACIADDYQRGKL